MKMQALHNLEDMIKKVPELPEQTRSMLLGEVKEAKSPLQTDKMIYRLVVSGLVLAILACLFFTFYITLQNTDPATEIKMPEIFMAIGSAAVGALAGLLAPSPSRADG